MAARLDREVLIIDDDPDIGRVVALMLRPVVERVRVETSGKAGVAAARERRPDLILCDVGMADIDGFEVRRQLTADQALAEVPFLFLSGRDSVEEQLAGLRLGAGGFIVKPFKAEALIAAVVHQLESSRAAPRETGGQLSGRLDVIPFTDLLQLLESSRATGVLSIMGRAINGEMALRQGKLMSARVNNRSGEDAALRLIWMSNGTFQFERREIAEPPSGRIWVVSRLLIDAAWLQDELRRLGSQAPGVDDRFQIVDRAAAAKLFPESSEWQMVASDWQADMTIGQLAEQFAISSYRARAILGAAAEKGAVRIVSTAE